MSALLVDELIVPLPTKRLRTQPPAGGWRHVERDPRARPHLAARPAQAPAQALYAGQPAPLRLTDRGLAVVVGFFLALVAIAAVVLVTSFLGVSNEPTPARAPVSSVIAGQA